MQKEEYDEWMSIGEDIPVAATLTDLEICQAVCEQEQAIKVDDSDGDECVAENPPTKARNKRHEFALAPLNNPRDTMATLYFPLCTRDTDLAFSLHMHSEEGGELHSVFFLICWESLTVSVGGTICQIDGLAPRNGSRRVWGRMPVEA
ncbi:hypothetical protein AVEN_249005-1 [Araneus ventricosus]|uniref:Uncharacterized protein n=1 Tax=Araneus ventricosus TaxID=182803 RepID=A0A4Y2UM83_ARAVE|nr:hypothetical protein AVEN_249005-1 [Araneus ventricosus]